MVWALTTYESEVSFFKVFQSPAFTFFSSCESGLCYKDFLFSGTLQRFLCETLQSTLYFVSVVSGCKSSLPTREEY